MAFIPIKVSVNNAEQIALNVQQQDAHNVNQVMLQLAEIVLLVE